MNRPPPLMRADVTPAHRAAGRERRIHPARADGARRSRGGPSAERCGPPEIDYGLPRGRGRHLRRRRAPRPASRRLARGTFNAGVLSEIGSFGGMFRPDFSRATRSRCSSPRPTASAPRSRSRSPAGRPRHRGLRPRRPLRERHPRAGRGAALLPRLHRPRQDGPRRASRRSSRGFARGLHASSAARSSAARRRRCRAPTRPTTTTWPASSWASSTARRPSPAPTCARATSLLGLPSAGLHTNGYTPGAQGALRRDGLSTSTRTCPSSGTTVGAALLAPHRGYLAALGAAARARQDPRPRPHHGRRLPGNIPRVLPEGLGARVRRGSWAVPPLFRLIQKGGGVAERGDVPDLQHGHRHGGGRSPRGPARRRAFARAARARRASSSARWCAGSGVLLE